MLLQKCQQLVVEETGISSYQADLLALLPQREGFFEKLHYSPAGAAVATAEPAVENKVSLRQHREQRVMAGPPMLARVVVDVIHMPGEVVIIANAVLAEAALPDAAFALA